MEVDTSTGLVVMEPDKVCRLCLCKIEIKNSLLEDNYTEMLEALTSIKIDETEELPTNACIGCYLNIRFAYRVQQAIISTDKKMRQIAFTNLELIKEERDEDTAFEYAPEEVLIKGENFEGEIDITVGSLVTKSSNTCTICGEFEPTNLTNHIREHFDNEQECDDCGTIFPNISEYRTHVADLHSNYPAVFVCEQCPARFQYKSLYGVHIHKAHPIKQEAQIMDFLDEDDMPNNVKAVKRRRTTVRATTRKTRNKSTKIELALLPPIATDVKSADKSLQCNDCSKVCESDAHYLKHVEQHEKKTCPICNAQISRYNFNKHVLIHSAGPSICHLCGVTCKNYDSLRGHLYYTHSKNKFPCEHCDKVFKKSYSRVLHVKKEHTGEKNHVCDTCGKAFFTHYCLSKHIKMTHLKLRPYVCEHCQKGFSSRFALRTHERQHTNVTPYKCPICGEGFRQNVSLRAHKKSKHNIIVPFYRSVVKLLTALQEK